MSPYEYHNDKLGVQSRFLFTGRNQAQESLGVISYRAIMDRVSVGTLKQLRSGCVNNPALIAWESLPMAWQRMLIERFGETPSLVRKMLFEKFYQRDTKAFAFYTAYKLADGRYLPDETVDEYTINASVLNTMAVVYDKRHSLRKAMRGKLADVWDTVARETQIFRKVQPHTLPDNERRLRDKFNAYKRNGYAELVHRNFANNNARKVNADIEQLLNNLFATQPDKPTATEIARQYDAFLLGTLEIINNETGEMYAPDMFEPLSIPTITGYLGKWRNKVGTHSKRSGDRQVLMGKFKPYHSLSQPKLAGSIISIDDRQPPFEYAPGKRMWFYNGIDLGSEAFICWVYGKTKEGIITEFYRQLVRNYTLWGLNMPAELEAESSLNSSFKETFLREGAMFEYVRIEANNARGKRIEAYYRPLRYGLEKKREGWLARPFALSESNQKGGVTVPMVPYNEIIAGCLKDIETWNNMPHSKIPGKTRWEVFMENQNPNTQPTNWRAILPSLGIHTITSCKVGIVKLNHMEFLLGQDGKLAFGESLIWLMDLVEGREIDVYWLDDNRGHVLRALAYEHGTDRYLCDLIAKPVYSRATIERTPEDDLRREEMSKYVASIEGYMNRRRKAIDTVTVIDNRKVTLNNKFSITDMMPLAVESAPIDKFEADTEMLEMPDDDINDIEIPLKRDLKDRW
jgi:hypothetical protein